MIKNGKGTETAWAVFNKGGYILLNTIRKQRKEAIEAFIKNFWLVGFTDWEAIRKQYGVYVAKVDVTVKEVKG